MNRFSSAAEMVKADKMAFRTVVFLGRAVLGAILVYSALPKLAAPHEFLEALFNYDILGRQACIMAAIVIPTAELVVGLCLVFGSCLELALPASAFLFLVFGLAQVSVLWRELAISCGCFGGAAEQVSYWTLLRAVELLLLSASVSAAHYLELKWATLEHILPQAKDTDA